MCKSHQHRNYFGIAQEKSVNFYIFLQFRESPSGHQPKPSMARPTETETAAPDETVPETVPEPMEVAPANVSTTPEVSFSTISTLQKLQR